jgi:NAD(P)-dependent dehydrogenase (short-subunit alcohol dehydrogenase family)
MHIVITGNSSGIGLMLQERLEKQGHFVIGLSRTSPYKCDVTDYEQVSEWARFALDAWDGVDALITCAGTQGELGKLHLTDTEKWCDTISVNLFGAYNAIHAFYPIMDQSRRGKIICLAGGGAGEGRPYFSAYSCAKTAVVRMVETFALEQPEIDINAVAPGAINTHIIDGALKAGPEVIGKSEYDKALNQCKGGDNPDSALELIDWLLSKQSDGVSGRFISSKWDDYKSLNPSVSNEMYRLRRMTQP